VVGDPGGGHRLGVDPSADQCALQRHGVRFGQRPEFDAGRAMPGDQARQVVAAGYHDRARTGAGQQRTHLFGVGGVVQHNQHPASREQAAVPAGARRPGDVRPAGPGSVRVGQFRQEHRQRLRRGNRWARVVAAQVDVELTVGKSVRPRLRPVPGEGRLADACWSTQDGDGGCRLLGPPGCEQPIEHRQLDRPAGERRHG
jgi:hypothetical protein